MPDPESTFSAALQHLHNNNLKDHGDCHNNRNLSESPRDRLPRFENQRLAPLVHRDTLHPHTNVLATIAIPATMVATIVSVALIDVRYGPRELDR